MIKVAKYHLLLCVLMLLNGCHNSTMDSVETAAQKQPPQEKLFTLLPSEQTHVDFANVLPENERMNNMVYEYYYNGGGVAIGDINNDDLPDIYFTGNVVPNRMYLNKGGLRFEDFTDKAGLQGKNGWATGVVMADVNNDGLLDIYVSRSGRVEEAKRANELFINNGDLTFTEKAEAYGLDDPAYSTQAAFFDYDRDGDLDLYLLNHGVEARQFYDIQAVKRQRDPLVGDKLYRNDIKSGVFTDISEPAGIMGNPLGYGLGVSIGDLNNDSWPDIYVANDYSEHDYLYLNNGDGTFRETLKEVTGHTSNFSMGTDIADFNHDGWQDIMVLDMIAEDNYGIKTSMSGMDPKRFNKAVEDGFHYQYMFNALQMNQGANTHQVPHFSEIAQLAGVSNTDWSWAPLMADFDNDGWQDLFVTNGLKRDFRNNDYRNYKIQRIAQAKKDPEVDKTKLINELIRLTPTRKTANYIFKNNGDLTFDKNTDEWGFDQPSWSNGAAFADLDNDGDLDIVVNNVTDKAFIYRNNSRQVNKNHYLKIKLVGNVHNPDGIGARVELKANNQYQLYEHYLTRGYQSSVDRVIHFGLGKETVIEGILITWPDGAQQKVKNVKADQVLTLNHKNAALPAKKVVKDKPSLFTDITSGSGIKYKHQENSYNDFQKQLLLPHKMSNFGPGIAVGDVNNDGLEDVFVGAAKGHAGKLFIQQSNKKFVASTRQPWKQDKGSEDMGAALFDADTDGDLDLYIVSGGNAFAPDASELQDRLYINNGKGNFSKATSALPKMLTSGSRVVPGDYDKDGDLDLFVGGRLVPGKYPYPARSYILRNDEGTFSDVTASLVPELSQLGMVTDALWTDFDADGNVDLMIVGEWMPVTVLKGDGQKFTNITSSTGLSKSNGWWFSIAANDWDGDGDMDFVAGNLGQNYKYKASEKEPFHVYSHDFDENGSLDIVLGYYNSGEMYPLRGRECSSEQMPFIKTKFPDYKSFGLATLEEVYGKEKLNKALHYEARHFATSIIENLGNGRFKISKLPNHAQLSSVNDILIEDFDQDGVKDMVLAGNLYASEVETPRNDAGIGIFLKRKGKGNFKPVPHAQSGLFMKGDVKALALIKLGKDNEKAIIAAKNNDYLQLVKINNAIKDNRISMNGE